jgi:hypothetical protein
MKTKASRRGIEGRLAEVTEQISRQRTRHRTAMRFGAEQQESENRKAKASGHTHLERASQRSSAAATS